MLLAGGARVEEKASPVEVGKPFPNEKFSIVTPEGAVKEGSELPKGSIAFLMNAGPSLNTGVTVEAGYCPGGSGCSGQAEKIRENLAKFLEFGKVYLASTRPIEDLKKMAKMFGLDMLHIPPDQAERLALKLQKPTGWSHPHFQRGVMITDHDGIVRAKEEVDLTLFSEDKTPGRSGEVAKNFVTQVLEVMLPKLREQFNFPKKASIPSPEPSRSLVV